MPNSHAMIVNVSPSERINIMISVGEEKKSAHVHVDDNLSMGLHGSNHYDSGYIYSSGTQFYFQAA
jgi:hypothetical protein